MSFMQLYWWPVASEIHKNGELKKETYLIDINDELYQVTFKSYI